MTRPYRVPELSGACCSCPECVMAGMTDKPVVRTPEGELHGAKLARFYAEQAKFKAAMGKFPGLKAMPKAIVQREPGEEG